MSYSRSECILDMIPQPKAAERKAPMYQSKYNPNMPPTGSTFGGHGSRAPPGAAVGLEIKPGVKQSGRSFGTALGKGRPDPNRFLKKGEKMPAALKTYNQASYQRTKKSMKAKVPSRNDVPIMGLQSTKNYVTSNAVEAILAVPGHRARVTEQQPQYRHKVDYGRVPHYLNDVNEEIKRENAMIEEYLGQNNNSSDPDEGEMFPEQQQSELLDALKTKWGDVNKKYQLLTHQTKLDTIGKVRRKEGHEKHLDEIEKDIAKVSGKRIEVMEDNQYGDYY